MKRLIIEFALVGMAVCLTGCGEKDSDNDNDTIIEISTEDDKTTQNTDVDICDGYAAPLEYNEEFEEIFGRIEGDWLSEDGLVGVSISYDGEQYIYSDYLADECSDAYDQNAYIFRLKYEEKTYYDLKDNEQMVSIFGNSEIMQTSIVLAIDKDNGYIRYFIDAGTSVNLYPYDRNNNNNLSVQDCITIADVANMLNNTLSNYNLDYISLRNTAEKLFLEYKVIYVYEHHMSVDKKDDENINISMLCRTIGEDGKYFPTEDIRLLLTVDMQGNYISVSEE